MTDASVDATFVDGKPYTLDDLTYREQREMRDLARQLAPDGDLEEAGEIDYAAALVCVVKRRESAEFTLEQALDVKPADMAPKAEGKARPSRARASK